MWSLLFAPFWLVEGSDILRIFIRNEFFHFV